MNKLVWFREDLRLLDNPALSAACQSNNSKVYALYIATPKQWEMHDWSEIKIALIHKRLKALQTELTELNIHLELIVANEFKEIPPLIEAYCLSHQISEIYFNRDVGVNEAHRDSALLKRMDGVGINTFTFDCRAIFPPGSILTGKGQPFSVFTPFKRRWLERLQLTGLNVLARPHKQLHSSLNGEQKELPWPLPDNAQLLSEWPCTEAEILDRLRRFSAECVDDYATHRDLPSLEGTSRLSPYLAIGALSGNQCVSRILFDHGHELSQLSKGVEVWLSELVWRDFYRHLLEAYPRLSKHQPFKLNYADLAWLNKIEQFQAWCAGRTGYPLVDAGMRQLNATGWMHNRVRMVVASFLTKHLQIDWRWGEKYFMENLIDGDLAANNGGWQWAASTGADAVPYFRIFNPLLQAKRFDPQGTYIKTWVPELREFSAPAIFEPHKAKSVCLSTEAYPLPIVDHTTAREAALALYKGV